jgi:hypothetical protein
MNPAEELEDFLQGKATACFSEAIEARTRLPFEDSPPTGQISLRHAGDSWLVGFFLLMAFVSRGKLPFDGSRVSRLCVLLLPALVVSAFVYNLFVYRKKYRAWDGTFMCRRCGALINAHGSSPGAGYSFLK